MKEIALRHEFVEYLPTELEKGTIYISMLFATAAHLCACGCGQEVVTPICPTDWQLLFDGVSVSLTPSIGNWGFPCQSHYWIRHNKIQWAGQWSRREIEANRAHDRRAKERYFGPARVSSESKEPKGAKGAKSRWQLFRERFF